MKKLNLTFKNLIENKKLTFLVGAGCSVDPPYNLPSGNKFLKALITYSSAESEIERILEIKDLRFEQLVEIIRDELDPQLKIIEYFGLCDSPNLQHFFLAEMLKEGDFVMTTNFDHLIEYALEQSGVPKDRIVPVITQNDFESYSNPKKLFKEGKNGIYKIHGSSKNIITKENTKDSLIATIQALGAGKEGGTTFQVEPFKRSLFDNISKGRTIVVIGYSGSDDFDVVPTLKMLKEVEDIIWIDYTSNDGGSEQIYEIKEANLTEFHESDKIGRILSDIFKMQNAIHVYRIKANTSRLIQTFLGEYLIPNKEEFSVNLAEWLAQNIKTPNEFQKYAIPYKVYFGLDMYQDKLRCLKKIEGIAEQKKSLSWKRFALTGIGLIYDARGNYPKALECFELALGIAEKLNNLTGKGTNLNNIGGIHYKQGNYPEALNHYEEALKIAEQLDDLSGKSTYFSNIGGIYYAQGNYSKALNHYENALQIVDQLGDPSRKATLLNNIALIYKSKGNYPKAFKRYEEALKIDEYLGNLSGKSTFLNNIGLIYKAQGHYSKALKNFENALSVAEKLGDLSVKSVSLNCIGDIFRIQGNYSEAMKHYEDALKFAKQIGDLSKIATRLNNIGLINKLQGKYPKALKLYEKALKIAENLGLLSKKVTFLNNIGSIYCTQQSYEEALPCFIEALNIAEKLSEKPYQARENWWLGRIYTQLGKKNKAMIYLRRALKIYRDLGLEGKTQKIQYEINDLIKRFKKF